jgi:hypothetical protein
VLPVIGELVIVITPPRRKMPPAPPRGALLALTGELVRVVRVEAMATIPPPCASKLVLLPTGVLVVVNVPLRPL